MKFKEQIRALINRLGEGLVEPVAYDTAWTARVPQLKNLSKPAFPEALQWLRDHQLTDGSWGTDKPLYAHGNTLSTLAAVLVLAQWKDPNDGERISQGVKSLWQLAEKLVYESCESVGFELLLPSLVEEAREFKLNIPYEYYATYQNRSKEKLQLIAAYQNMLGKNQSATWWHSLELLNRMPDNAKQILEFEINENILEKNGSIVATPAATAFALLSARRQGFDLPKAEKYLKEIILKNQGGLPCLFPIEEFETCFAIDFFLKAGLDAKHPLLSPSIKFMAEHYMARNGVGYSQYFPLIDADDTAITLQTLYLAGYPVSPEPLLAFFNGKCVNAYLGERTPSISVNLTALKVLLLFKGQSKSVDEAIFKISSWIVKTILPLGQEIVLNDKWHISPYYSTSRAIFSLHPLDNQLAQHCINWLLKEQHKDGGWGIQNQSTFEETAHVVLALCYSVQQEYKINHQQLHTAFHFLNKSGEKLVKESLWIGKVLYCPTYISASAVVAARYALQRTLLLQFGSEHLHTLKFNLGKISNKESANTIQLVGKFMYSDSRLPNQQATLANQHNTQWAIHLNLWKSEAPILKANFAAGCAYAFFKESLEDLNVAADFSLLIVTLDDLLDTRINHINDKALQQAFAIFLNIMADQHHPNSKSMINFPKFNSLCKAFHDIQQRLLIKNIDLSPLLLTLKDFFEHLIQEFNGYFDTSDLTLTNYLNKRGVLTGAPSIYEMGLILRGIILDKAILENEFYQEIKTTAFQAVAIVNDLLSLIKELEQDEGKTNYVFLKQQENLLSLQQAYEAGIQAYNQCMLKIIFLEQKLMENPVIRANKPLHESILLLKNIIYGNLFWSLETKRYQKKNAFVELNSTKPSIRELSQLINQELEEIILAFTYHIPGKENKDQVPSKPTTITGWL